MHFFKYFFYIMYDYEILAEHRYPKDERNKMGIVLSVCNDVCM